MSDSATLRRIGNRTIIPMVPLVSREAERQTNEIIRDSLAALSNGRSAYNQYVEDTLYDGESLYSPYFFYSHL